MPPEAEVEVPQQDVDPDAQYIEKLREIHSFSDRIDLNQHPQGVFKSNSRREPALKSELVNSLLANGEADSLLAEYRSMSKSFPFVPISPSTTAQELSATAPMLLFAMLTVGSWRNHKQQRALDLQYRTELANRTIIHPRRTLPLLQGVLVYLSW